MDIKKGLFRLWIVSAVLWLGYNLVIKAGEIAGYSAYHYGLVKEHGFSGGFERKNHYMEVTRICKQVEKEFDRCYGDYQDIGAQMAAEARGETFDTTNREKGKEICSLQYEKSAAKLFSESGYTEITNFKGCEHFASMEHPQIRWGYIIQVLFITVLPLIVWWIGSWVLRGFSREN